MHALLADPGVTEVVAAPGNPGIAARVTTEPVDVADPASIAELARRLTVDLVVVGPEVPLVAGAADAVRAAGIDCFGPSVAAARLEGSKAFAKDVMASGVYPRRVRSSARPQQYAIAATPGHVYCPSTGSVLMRQRVALARALAQSAEILLMDEPFGALDAMTRDLLHDELEALWTRTGLTMLFVTHNVREAVRLGDRVVLLTSRPGPHRGGVPVDDPAAAPHRLHPGRRRSRRPSPTDSGKRCAAMATHPRS